MKNIIIPESNKMVLHSPDDILYLESDTNYCNIHLKYRETPVTLSKCLTRVESLLDPDCFCRINRRQVINLTKIIEYKYNKDNYVIIEGGLKFEFSRQGKREFKDKLKQLYIIL
jgi:DNA-binding LytR/AlgR family response regulator